MDNCVRVVPSRAGNWTVEVGRSLDSLSFRKRPSALAYGRALAHATKRELVVLSLDGEAVRQPRASLTYPMVLD